jgi:hypothetical protein
MGSSKYSGGDRSDSYQRYPSRGVAAANGGGNSDFVTSELEMQAQLQESANATRRDNDRRKNAAVLPNMLSVSDQQHVRAWDVCANQRVGLNNDPPWCENLGLGEPCSSDKRVSSALLLKLRRPENCHLPSVMACNCAMAAELDRQLVNPWTDTEKAIFVDKFLQNPKGFRQIAQHLRNKNHRDVMSFYYDSKKVCNYKLLLREQNSVRRRQQQRRPLWRITEAGLKMLGVKVPEQAIVACLEDILLEHAIDQADSQATPSLPFTSSNSRAPSRVGSPTGKSTASPVPDVDTEAVWNAVDEELAASINMKLKIKGMSVMEMMAYAEKIGKPVEPYLAPYIGDNTYSTLPAPLNAAERELQAKRIFSTEVVEEIPSAAPDGRSGQPTTRGGRTSPASIRGRGVGRPAIRGGAAFGGSGGTKKHRNKELAQAGGDMVIGSAGVGVAGAAAIAARGGSSRAPRTQAQKWNDAEKAKFMRLLHLHGKDWYTISGLIGTKTHPQVKNYYQNYKNRLGLQKIVDDFDARQSEDKSTNGTPALSNGTSSSGGVLLTSMKAKPSAVAAVANSPSNDADRVRLQQRIKEEAALALAKQQQQHNMTNISGALVTDMDTSATDKADISMAPPHVTQQHVLLSKPPQIPSLAQATFAGVPPFNLGQLLGQPLQPQGPVSALNTQVHMPGVTVAGAKADSNSHGNTDSVK